MLSYLGENQASGTLCLVEGNTGKECSVELGGRLFSDESHYPIPPAHHPGLKTKGRAASLQMSSEERNLP